MEAPSILRLLSLQNPTHTCAGLDFILDANLRPWLLEVNASPSLAWAHQQPATAALMRSIKSQMLADMAALLRLQDRFPASSSSSSAGPEATAADGSTQVSQQASAAVGDPPAVLQQARATSRRREKTAHNRAAQQQQQQQQQAAVNPLLLQAASGRYFADRPQVLQLVRAAEQRLHAAVAVCPSLQQVQQQMECAMLAEQQQARKEGRMPSAHRSASGSAVRSSAGDNSSQGMLDDSSTTNPQQQFDAQEGQGSKSAVLQQLVELEAELRSAGGWQSLMPYMLSCMQQHDGQPDSVDAAVQRFWQQRC
jgi:hypothetical protein